jgi:hypothetical protein
MRYWWVNQNQTYRHEVDGGYLWSPKRKTNGHRNPFYDFMRETAPGDVVFSFSDGRIKAIGIVRSHAYESPKPIEFANAGAYWDKIGWRVDVFFSELTFGARPADHMHELAKLLPDHYSPLRANGHGLQSVYLTAIPPAFATALLTILGPEAKNLARTARGADAAPEALPAVGLLEWEQHQLDEIAADESMNPTTRLAVVLARRGQGKFKENVLKIERHCRITKVDRVEHLRASHCKPWRDSNNFERLDGENGFLLTPTMDHLFDRGFISFEDKGELLVSPVADKDSLVKMGLDPAGKLNVGVFSTGQRKYLDFHRESVFLQARGVGNVLAS